MSKESFLKFFNILQEKKPDLRKLISLVEQFFPNKKEKIFETLRRGTVKYECYPSQRIIWIVKGNNKDYHILPKVYCSCSDFYKNVVISRNQDFCKHLIVQVISESLDDYTTIRLKDRDFQKLIDSL